MKSVFLFFIVLLLPLSLHAKTLETVTLQLQWLDQFQFGGYYMAIEKGFYEEAGLDVHLKKFSNDIDTTEEVISGRANYGIGRASIMTEYCNDKPIVALSAIFQSSPHILLARKDSGIKTIKDFVGKRIMLTSDVQDDVTIQSMLISQGISFDDIIPLNHSFDLNDLIQGKTDLMASYVSNEPFRMQELGIESVGFTPKEYGFDYYSDILFTSQKELQEHPARVNAFLMATIKGWRYAFDHIEETADVIIKHYNVQNKSRESLIFEGQALKKLAYTDNLPLGHIAIEKFKTILNMYRVMGKTKYSKENFDDFIYHSAINTPLQLTSQEEAFLKAHKITAISTGKWAPFNFSLPGDMKMISGIAVDLWEHIIRMHAIDNRLEYASDWQKVLKAIRTRQADITLGTEKSPEKSRYALFSKPYGHFPNVIATEKSVNYIPNLAMLEGKKVAVGSGYTIEEKLRTSYPKIDLLPVQSTDEALKLLHQKKVFAVVDIVPVLSYAIARNGYDDIIISGTTEFDQSLRFMIRDDYPELVSIINKSIDAIPAYLLDEIVSRYAISPTNTSPIHWELILQVLAVAVLIIVFLLYRQMTLKCHNRSLLALSMTDPLTKIDNRMRLDQEINDKIEKYHRYKRPFVLILFDIDDFKKINDHFGHLAGDEILIKLTRLVKKHLRVTDIFGRWGGEEFMIICPETNIEGGRQLADMLCGILKEDKMGEYGPISCSFGVTDMHDNDTAATIIKRVDDAMYQAKDKGKDQVFVL